MCMGQTEPMPKIVTDVKAGDLSAYFSGQPFVACDIETAPETREQSWTGKDPTRALLRTVGFGTPTVGLSYKWGTDEKVEAEIKRLLENPSIPKIFHNGDWFDLRVLGRYGMDTCNYEDTRDMRRTLSSVSALSLRHLASIYTDFPAWKDSSDEDSKGVIFTEDYEELKKYNALDCVATARIYQRMLSEMRCEGYEYRTTPGPIP